ncbi:MAG TPA: hypothetical protein VKU02_16340 [Gemmataceae bacterium]|nr:hypothetical protein [Gemmataceae bacterium]
MENLDLTPDDLGRILIIGRRFLINETTRPEDLKAVLIQRLRDGQPVLAGKIQQLSDPQMVSLCQAMLAQQHSLA